MPDEIDTRSYDELNAALALAQHTVYKKYIDEIDSYPVVAPNELLQFEDAKDYVRAFHLTQLTCKKGEDIFQKLSTVYHAAMSRGSSLFVMVDVANPVAPANIYLGIREPLDREDTEAQNREKLRVSFAALEDGLLSNFPGSQVQRVSPSKELPTLLDEIFSPTSKYISSVSCVASIRDKSKTEEKGFIQGLEKLIDVMRGKTYTALLIADPVSPQQQADIRSGYESLYSTLSPFRKSSWSYNENESKSVMESLSRGTTETVTDSISHTQSHTLGHATGTSNTLGAGVSFGGSKSDAQSNSSTHSETNPTDRSRAGAVLETGGGKILGKVAGNAAAGLLSLVPGGAVFAPIVKIGVEKLTGTAVSAVGAAMKGESVTDAITEGISKTIGLNAGLNANYSHTNFKSDNESDTTSDGTTKSTAKGTSNTSTKGTTDTKGTSRTLQIENTNKAIEEMLSRIDAQLQRAKEGEDYGAYNCGAYFLSPKKEYSMLAANTYRALLLGEGSSVESGAVNFWDDQDRVDTIKEYLRHFAQPIFAEPLIEQNGEVEYSVCSPGTIVSGLELPLHLGLPTKSVHGLAVIDHAEFGRNPPVFQSEHVRLGSLYHMGRLEENTPVLLDAQNLTAHTFITGSTGSGKSNTICTLLDRLCLSAEKPAKFLVIESAKGEYKNAVGTYSGVSVYGTNPKLSPLLRLNPFSFPAEIHVLEHIDRLVEVFNACWPMYAAMPAVLKDAIESSYTACGWSVTRSVCAVPDRFPTFADVLKKLPEIMNSSAYSADTKGDYTGALVTRVKSLTNGLNGQIFCADDFIADSALFDANAIVDLSRIGSMETKALLMGILMIKLQEYRMAKAVDSNTELKHITILEEAHNLLRRTSTEQSQDSSNLQGKSVEMLANAIAEMRTYGEGFIIADQAPGLLDMAVIRNTNTKIIMRLPDESDRKLVGRAAGLNDDQIVELTRLERGVAAVYQNGWLEPVLCKVDKFEGDGKKYTYRQPQQGTDPDMEFYFNLLLHGVSDNYESSKETVDKLKRWIDRQDINAEGKELLRDVMNTPERLTEDNRRKVLYGILHGPSLVGLRRNSPDPEAARKMIDMQISDTLHINAELSEEIRKQIFLRAAEQARDKSNETLYNELLIYGGVR